MKKIKGFLIVFILVLSIIVPVDSKVTYVSYNTAVQQVKKAMMKHQKTLKIHVKKSINYTGENQLPNALINSARKYNGKAYEGAYIWCDFRIWEANFSWYGNTRSDITFTFYYRISMKEEKKLKTYVNNFKKKYINGKKLTKNQKLQRIYNYIYKNVKYDFKAESKMNQISGTMNQLKNKLIYRSQTPYCALVEKKAICQGIANLFTVLCLSCGIESHVYYDDYHCWNDAVINKKTYGFDATWESVDYHNSLSKKKYKTMYYKFRITDRYYTLKI